MIAGGLAQQLRFKKLMIPGGGLAPPARDQGWHRKEVEDQAGAEYSRGFLRIVHCPISYPRGGIGGQILAALLGGASISATAAATSGGGISIGSIVSDLAGGASAAQT